jgi:hypothetical protein
MNMQRHSFIVIILVFFSAFFVAPPTYAEDRCNGAAVTEVRSLEALPNQLRQLLPSSTSGVDGMADRGGRFNATDVIVHDWPMRRFVLAAIGTSCAVVAVEYGGRAHGFELTEYLLTGEGWKAGERRTLSSEPKSTGDLLDARADPPPPIVKHDAEVNCINRDGSCEVIRLADRRRATLPRSGVLPYVTDELRLPIKSKLQLDAREGDFSALKLQLEAPGYRIVSSMVIGLRPKEPKD